MRKILFTSLLMLSGHALAEGVLNDSDIPAMRDALKKSYTYEQCQKDIPNASKETCNCLGEAMAKNLNADKLKLCQKEGYDECVATEFAAAKSNLTDKQISDCKASTAASPAADEDDESE